MCHLARLIHRLIVEARAHNVKWRHAKHHHHTADHAGGEGHQPAVLGKHLGKQKYHGSPISDWVMMTAMQIFFFFFLTQVKVKIS